MLIFMWMYVFNISQKKPSQAVLSKTEDYSVVHTSSAPSRSPAPSIRMYA